VLPEDIDTSPLQNGQMFGGTIINNAIASPQPSPMSPVTPSTIMANDMHSPYTLLALPNLLNGNVDTYQPQQMSPFRESNMNNHNFLLLNNNNNNNYDNYDDNNNNNNNNNNNKINNNNNNNSNNKTKNNDNNNSNFKNNNNNNNQFNNCDNSNTNNLTTPTETLFYNLQTNNNNNNCFSTMPSTVVNQSRSPFTQQQQQYEPSNIMNDLDNGRLSTFQPNDLTSQPPQYINQVETIGNPEFSLSTEIDLAIKSSDLLRTSGLLMQIDEANMSDSFSRLYYK